MGSPAWSDLADAITVLMLRAEGLEGERQARVLHAAQRLSTLADTLYPDDVFRCEEVDAFMARTLHWQERGQAEEIGGLTMD